MRNFRRQTGGRKNYRFEWERDEGLCRYCGEEGECVDHVLPWSYVPDDSSRNVVVSCTRCNRIGDRHVFVDFDAKRDYILTLRRAELIAEMESNEVWFE